MKIILSMQLYNVIVHEAKGLLSIITGTINCVADWSCPDVLACGDDDQCINPCSKCSVNATCEVTNHKAVCICNPGYEGCKEYGMPT